MACSIRAVPLALPARCVPSHTRACTCACTGASVPNALTARSCSAHLACPRSCCALARRHYAAL
eukprot:7914963-Alexandrium_andersonii.AAC.1